MAVAVRDLLSRRAFRTPSRHLGRWQRGVGNVVTVLGDDALPMAIRNPSSRATALGDVFTSEGRKGTVGPSGFEFFTKEQPVQKRKEVQKETPKLSYQHYPLPTEYVNLLDKFDATRVPSSSSSAQPKLAELEEGDSEENQLTPEQQLRRDILALAKRRLAKLGRDATAAERRIAELHESLFLEELAVKVELQRWKSTVQELHRVGDGLYELDVREVHDQLERPELLQGILRGARIKLTCSAGNELLCAAEPGGSGSMIVVSGPRSLADATGPFNLEFQPYRFQQLAMHRALDSEQASLLIRATTVDETSSPQLAAESRPAEKISGTEKLNAVQRMAVEAMLDPTPDQRAAVIWGPPGTGKTTLAAYLVWLLIQRKPTGLRVLVAAPSNTGADVMCEKLEKLGLGPSHMLRLNALGRSPAAVPQTLRKFCFTSSTEDRESFAIPPLEDLRSKLVVVTTCICAHHIVEKLKKETAAGWFSHVLLDEAGEATEPETLVPLSLLRSVAGQLVLLGDHYQLGPLVISPLAMRVGKLDVSMIARVASERFNAVKAIEGDLTQNTLMECQKKGLFFLTESYRSHATIMDLYSHLFYADQLEHKPREIQNQLVDFFKSRGSQQGPIILHNIVGRELRDRGSASAYNLREVQIVRSYLHYLLTETQLKGSDIGIITPYTKQVREMHQMLKEMGRLAEGVDCGTVEKFQGQERRVVIFSTVRCKNSPGSSEAARRPIGFLSDPRRLNVAISRAVAGLILVGDMSTLAAHSKNWRELVYIAQEKGYLKGEAVAQEALGRPVPEPHTPEVETAQEVPVNPEEVSVAWEKLTEA